MRLELCRIPCSGRISAATAAFTHGLLEQAGRRPALLTPEGGLIAGRLFPQRPIRDESREWERLLATHVRWGGDCLVVEEDSEIRDLLGGVVPRSILHPAPSTRVRIGVQALHWRGTRLQLLSDEAPPRTTHLPLVGSSNLRALEIALNRVLHSGCQTARAMAALPLIDPPAGLLEPVNAGQPFGVFVDRAAGAMELAELLLEARSLTGRRILLVAGIHGGSTGAERLALGAAAGAADEVIFTSDNPRHTPPAAIVADLQRGHGGGALGLVDRNEAIRTAIRRARTDDLVLIVGKGARPIQEVGASVVPWDDRLHAREALATRGWVGDSL
jgi:UDP-N-acetylmuramyl tripeptide synthase